MDKSPSRRQLLALLGSTSVGVSAGCLHDSTESDTADDDEPTPTPQPTVPAVDCNPAEYQSLSTERPTGVWSPTRGNQRRTGANLEMESPGLADTDELQATKLFSASSVRLPAVADGTAYVSNGKTYAVDVDTGETEWSRYTKAVETPVVTQDTVYLSAGGAQIHALDRESGEFRWTTSIQQDVPRQETNQVIRTPPLVAGGNVIVGHYWLSGEDERNWFRALDIRCGSERWSLTVDKESPKGLATDGKTVYATTDHHVYALDAGDGTEHWRVNISDGQVDADAPPMLAGETVLVSANGTVHALAITDGSERWNTDDGPTAKHRPTVAEDRVFLVEDDPDRVHAFDSETGETQWTFTDVPQGIYTRLTYVAVRLYGFESNSGLIALDAQTGQQAVQVELPSLDATTSWGTISELAITASGIFVHSHKSGATTPDHVHRFYW